MTDEENMAPAKLRKEPNPKPSWAETLAAPLRDRIRPGGAHTGIARGEARGHDDAARQLEAILGRLSRYTGDIPRYCPQCRQRYEWYEATWDQGAQHDIGPCGHPLNPDSAEARELRSRVYAAISKERAYQDDKWGTITEHPLALGEYLLVLQGEIAEAVQAWRKGRVDDVRREIVQVAAVAVACLEQHGIAERGSQTA